MITRRMGQAAWRSGVLLVTAVVLASCGWHGVANVPMPGGPGTGRNHMTIYVQMPDTLAVSRR
jgi:phospholipid/cholesterol/gamma-HCH transport system substrate-binding protein